MPNYTPLYNLIKPLPSEPYDITQHNQNADIIEAELQKRLLATAYTANDVLAKIKTVDGSGSGLDADTVDGKHANAFATAAQGANADDLISGAKSAYNAQRLGNVDALSYAEKVYVREYLGTRGGDSAIFNETAHPTFGGGSYWELEDVDYMGGGTINVINETVGEIEAQFYFHLTYYGTPGVRIGLIDQDIKVGDKIYVALEAKVVDGTAMNSKLLFGANDTELIEDMQLTDTYKKFDQIFTVTSAQLNYSSGLISFRIRVHPASGLGYGYIGLMIKSMMVVNLTRSFSNAFAPTIAQVRAKLLAFDNSFFWASAPIYSLVKGLKDRVSTLEANASLFVFKKLTHAVSGGAAVIPKATLGVSYPPSYIWFASVMISGSILVSQVQSVTNNINVYIRGLDGSTPPDGEYEIHIFGRLMT